MRSIIAITFLLSMSAAAQASDFDKPWVDPQHALLLDPYQGNRLDLDKVATDKRVTAIIHKATQGLTTDKEYAGRRSAAKERDFLWGSYHLLTTDDSTAQIDNYLRVVGRDTKETHAIDVECILTDVSCQFANFKVSFNSVEAALRYFKLKTGKFPLLYLNDTVARKFAERWKDNAEFASVPLWYVRNKNSIKSVFPLGQWDTYRLWQFSSEINCNASSCPYRVPGTDPDIDVNVFAGTPAELRAAWPLDR